MTKKHRNKSANKYNHKSKGGRRSLLVTLLPLIFCVIFVAAFIFVVLTDVHLPIFEKDLASSSGEGESFPEYKSETVSAEQGESFVYDKESGSVSCGTYCFDEKAKPYTVIGNGSAHVYNLIFTSKDGIYIYNQIKKKQVRIGKNPFEGRLEVLSKSVFNDNENLYFLRAYERDWINRRWLSGYTRVFLYSWDTEVVSLGSKDGWEKLKDLAETTGSIWRKNGKYYYFDELGNSQGVYDTVFEIRDDVALEELTDSKNDIDGDKISKMQAGNKLKPVSGRVVLKASVRYRGYFLIIMFFSPFILALGIYTSHRRYKYCEKT